MYPKSKHCPDQFIKSMASSNGGCECNPIRRIVKTLKSGSWPFGVLNTRPGQWITTKTAREKQNLLGNRKVAEFCFYSLPLAARERSTFVKNFLRRRTDFGVISRYSSPFIISKPRSMVSFSGGISIIASPVLTFL